MRWIAITGWLAAAIFALLFFAGRAGSRPVYRDPEAEILRERVTELQERLENGTDGGPPPAVFPPAEAPRRIAPPFSLVVLSASNLPETGATQRFRDLQ